MEFTFRQNRISQNTSPPINRSSNADDLVELAHGEAFRGNESNRDIASLHAPLPSLDSRLCISMDNLQKSSQDKQFVGSCNGIDLQQEN